MLKFDNEQAAQRAADRYFADQMRRHRRVTGYRDYDSWSMGNTLIKALFWFIVLTFAIASCI